MIAIADDIDEILDKLVEKYGIAKIVKEKLVEPTPEELSRCYSLEIESMKKFVFTPPTLDAIDQIINANKKGLISSIVCTQTYQDYTDCSKHELTLSAEPMKYKTYKAKAFVPPAVPPPSPPPPPPPPPSPPHAVKDEMSEFLEKLLSEEE